MKRNITILILAIFMTMPATIKDLTSEYNCLKKQYPLLRQEWFDMINTECSKYKIEPSDICAIIEHEGKWNPNAININKTLIRGVYITTIDRGLMQLNSQHFRSEEEANLYFDPQLNIAKGVYEYHLCLEKSKGDKAVANRYYNAGRGSRPETYKNWNYVKKIANDRNLFSELENYFYSIK